MRRPLPATAALLAVLAASAPLAARAGSFETLFGVAPDQARDQAAEPPAGDAPERPGQGFRTYDLDQFETAAPRRRHEAAAPVPRPRPAAAGPITVMTDGTLEPGDAVMTERGIVVYAGDAHQDAYARHARADFVPLARSREAIGRGPWARLAGLERGAGPGATTGRSASTAPPSARGATIVDGRGRSVRYVGP